MACNPKKIISALYEEKDNIRDIVRYDIKTSKRLMLRKIPDGGQVEPHTNQESIEYGTGLQAPMKYKTLDHDPRDLVAGQMEGRNLAGRQGVFDTNIQSIDDNACHGFCTIKFAQGFKKRGFKDYSIDVDTPPQCARELSRLPREHVRGYFEAYRRNFTKFGLDNFDAQLINLVISEGEANASILGPNTFNLTKGGFQAPPQYRLSIHFLERYRDQIAAEMEVLGTEWRDDWRLEIEAPRDDWFTAIREHSRQLTLLAPGSSQFPLMSYQADVLKDPKDPLNGRAYHDYGYIRCYFNERPVRGYFKPVGTVSGNLQYEFVRVYPWINEVGGVGGLVLAPNPQYNNDSIRVDGADFDMCTLIPHVHPDSFRRYRLTKPVLMRGVEANLGVNYDVRVIDGAYIPNNEQGDRFKLVARHEFRFKSNKPELSGFIAYRHGREAGYVLSVTPQNLTPGPDNFAGPEQYRECDLIDPVTTAQCAQCGEVPTSEGNCTTAGAVANGTVSFDPAGTTANPVVTDYIGGTHTLRIAVRRRGELGKVGSVAFAVAQLGTPSAIAGTHFTAASGTLNFAAGDEYAYIDIAIIGASGNPANDLNFQVTLSTASGVTIGTPNPSIIRIHDAR